MAFPASGGCLPFLACAQPPSSKPTVAGHPFPTLHPSSALPFSRAISGPTCIVQDDLLSSPLLQSPFGHVKGHSHRRR